MPPNELLTHYGPAFYQGVNHPSLRSGQVVMPLILDLLKPASAVDVGCGQGEWLSVAASYGVEVLGVDGPHVADEQLLIPKDRFIRQDLSQPLKFDRQFDLAMSLEVGEHLPAAACAEFVATLTRLAPAVVFSAALPGQGGVHHINEQWPWYWRELFERRGYVRLDAFRRAIWQNPEVAYYYQQNLYLFVDPEVHKGLIDRIGVPDKLSELTLVKTTILQDMLRQGLLRRGVRKIARLFGGSDSR
jgi:SAM-dependent methyltransferase